jgi:hypothetical protein
MSFRTDPSNPRANRLVLTIPARSTHARRWGGRPDDALN